MQKSINVLLVAEKAAFNSEEKNNKSSVRSVVAKAISIIVQYVKEKGSFMRSVMSRFMCLKEYLIRLFSEKKELVTKVLKAKMEISTLKLISLKTSTLRWTD